MQIISFPAHYQSVYTNFDISSFSLISCNAKVWFLHAKSMVFAMQKGGFCNTGCFLFKMYRVYWGQQKMVLWLK